MKAPALLCAAVEVALNRTLRLEPAVAEECGRLAGRVIALDVEGPGWSFFIEFAPGGVRVLDELAGEPDVRVAGGLTTLMRLAWQVTQGEAGVPQGLRVDGDTELLSRFPSRSSESASECDSNRSSPPGLIQGRHYPLGDEARYLASSPRRISLLTCSSLT